MQEANKAPPDDQDGDIIIQSLPTKILNVKNISEALTCLQKYSNIVKDFYINTERISVVHMDVKAVDFFTKKRIRHGFKFSWKHFKKADERQ